MPTDRIVQEIILTGDEKLRARMRDLGLVGKDTFDKLNKGGRTVDDLSKQFGGAGDSGKAFAGVLRGIGKVVGVPELGKLGGAIGLVGKAAVVVIPLIAALGFEKIAASAAEAAGKVADLAGKLRSAAPEISALQNVSAATGVSTEGMGKSLEGVAKLIKDTAAADKQAEEAQAAYTTQLEKGRQATDKAAVSLETLKLKQENLNQSVADTAAAALEKDYSQPVTLADVRAQLKAQRDQWEAQRALNIQLKDAWQALEDADKAERDLSRARQLANVDIIQNGTALQKLGITAINANGKLKTTPGVLNEIADGLKAMGAGVERDQVEFDLMAAGLDRKLLPALRGGAAAFAAIQKDSARIQPPFTAAQVAIADKFAIAMQGAKSAWSGLVEQAGMKIAPLVAEFFGGVRNALVKLQPDLTAFADKIGNVLGPMMRGLGSYISSVFIPVLTGLKWAFDQIAKLINAVFGTDVSGGDVLVGVFVALAIALTGVFGIAIAVAAAIGAIIQYIKDNGGIWQSFSELATGAWTVIQDKARELLQNLYDWWAGWVQWFKDLGTAIAEAPQKAWDAIAESFNGMVVKIKGYWDTFVKWFKDHLPDVPDWLKGNAGGGTVSTQAMARGGRVSGPGTGTSDSILARLSAGEYVLRAAVVRRYGAGLFDAFNRMTMPVRGFAAGGMVDGLSAALGSVLPSPLAMPQPATAGAGSSRVLNLTIGSESFTGLRGDEDTMERLTHFAVRQQMRSPGRKPNWHR